MRAAFLALAALGAGLLLPGCDDTAGERPPPPDPAALEARLERLGARVERIVRRPWMVSLTALRQPLQDIHSRVVGLTYPEERPPGFVEDARAVLALEEGTLTGLLERLEAVAPVADRVWRLAREMDGLLGSVPLPEDAPFPLRTRFRDGWLPDKHDHFRHVAEGLRDFLDGKADTRYRIGRRNLERVAGEGAELHGRINAFARDVGLIEHKLRALDARMAWAERVVTRAREGGRHDAAVLQRIEAARKEAEAALPELRRRWKRILPAYANRPAAEREALLALMGDLDQHLGEVARRTNPVASDLGLPAPGLR